MVLYIRKCSEIANVKISSVESFCSTSQFLTHGNKTDTFVIMKKASTQKED